MGDGVEFPSGDAVKVGKEMAEEACAGLGEQRDNCITDLRMVNEPEAVAKIKEDFDRVESTVTTLEATTTTTESVDDRTSTESPDAVSSSTMTHLCVSTLALMTLLVV